MVGIAHAEVAAREGTITDPEVLSGLWKSMLFIHRAR